MAGYEGRESKKMWGNRRYQRAKENTESYQNSGILKRARKDIR